MTLNFDSYFCPCNDVVFAVMFGKKNLFCRLVSAVTGDQVELEGNPHTQATLFEDDVLLSTIRFDTFARALNHKFYSADMQRRYKAARQEKRTVYYACRAVSIQDVDNMTYESVRPVHISFILTDHNEKQAVRHIKLCDVETHEVYDDLIELTLVHVPAVVRAADKKSDLYIFAKFFSISSQEQADEFASKFSESDLGKELIVMYNTAIMQDPQKYKSSHYFSERLNEAELEALSHKMAETMAEKMAKKMAGQMAEQTRKKESITIAQKMLSDGLSPEFIAKYFDLDIDTIRSLEPPTQ
jgi:hypothetical protein